MKIDIVYRQEKGWFVGHIQEYPDYESQGRSLEELRDNLIEIYDDIRKGLVPNAENKGVKSPVDLWLRFWYLKSMSRSLQFGQQCLAGDCETTSEG